MNAFRQLVLLLFFLLFLIPSVAAGGPDRVKFGSNLVVEQGTRVGDAVAIGGDIQVRGTVSGNAVTVGGSIFMSPTGVIQGDAVSVGGRIEKPAGARIGRDIVELNIPGLASILAFLPDDGWRQALRVTRWITLAGFVFLSLLLVAIIPGPFNAISDRIGNNFLKVFLAGIGGVILIIPMAVVLLISVVGIVIIPVEAALVGGAFFVGYIAMARFIGARLTHALKQHDWGILWETLVGMIALWIVGWIPFIGFLLKGFAALIGFGGVIMSLFLVIRKQAGRPEVA